MNQDIDPKWQALLARSQSTFAAETTPPYGFVTSTLARLKTETREQAIAERIGLRALFASLTVLTAAVVLTVSLQFQNHADLDPGIRSLIQADNISIS